MIPWFPGLFTLYGEGPEDLSSSYVNQPRSVAQACHIRWHVYGIRGCHKQGSQQSRPRPWGHLKPLCRAGIFPRTSGLPFKGRLCLICTFLEARPRQWLKQAICPYAHMGEFSLSTLGLLALLGSLGIQTADGTIEPHACSLCPHSLTGLSTTVHICTPRHSYGAPEPGISLCCVVWASMYMGWYESEY
jgi:hypothetical protein